MLRLVVKVDKLCALRFLIVVKDYNCKSSYYKREGSSFITSELGVFEWSVFSDREETVASFAKFTISPVRFKHSSRCEKFESQNFKKIKFLHSDFRFVAFLPREVDGRVISELYLLNKNWISVAKGESLLKYHGGRMRDGTVVWAYNFH